MKPRLGLARRERLTRPADYRATLRDGCQIRDLLFTIRARLSLAGVARLGLVVSRRVAARAVQRNRIKRRVRESFRHHKPLLRGLDVVVMANPPLAAAAPAAQRATLDRLWRIVAEKCKSSSSD